ncbi:MAG TPA: hypothetical protein PLL30_04695 [Candidatus Krumholzibacteria bacterium]|nr:hypothetical protein [Candidatus Krumholzibacteria bacterium]HPD71067.1 hypothetical protein [Candidatus Krumholzibacteria bacterium]HRY39233.1 hypothetical protein [Candidatus Krumholzibacteria bacterium]
MKKLLALAIVALMAGGAMAQPGMGLFFSNSDFTSGQTNVNTVGAPFFAYIVILGVESGVSPDIGGYEVGLQFSDTVFILSVTGPNGWTNFGSNTNHLCGYQSAVIPVDGAAVLCTLNMLYSGAGLVEVTFGPATPPSIPGHDGPVLAGFANPDNLIACGLTSGPTVPGVVATFNGGGIIATEATTWTQLKNLFD